MQQAKENIWVIRGLILFGLLFSVVAFFTEVPAGGADNYAHFNISRWAFRYPHLFLDHWGKPVFTILTAPFAQLGLTAVRIFNIVAGLLTAWFCYRLAVHFKLKAAWFSVVVALFTPIYFVMLPTAMTEVLFSLVLVFSIYSFFREEYLLSAVVISFLFLVRSEGLAFLVFFFIALLVKQKYKAIPFLFTGFIVFSLIGWMYYYHDFWWLISKRPYSTGGTNVYGSGEWYHYLKNMPLYYGPLVPVFLLAGTVVILIRWIKTNFKLNSDPFFLLLLVLGSFWGYLFIHSFLWWKGETSAGLARVMAGVAPLIGILAAFAINALAIKINYKKKIYFFLLLLPALYLTGAAAEFFNRVLSRSPIVPVLKKTTQFLNRPENTKHKLVVHNPYFAWSTGRDAWDTDEIQYGFSNNELAGKNLPDSTLFVWDAQFSVNEGHMPLSMIMKNPDFELIDFFEPAYPYPVLGGNNYQIMIFRKISDVNSDNELALQKIRLKKIGKTTYYSDQYTFENAFSDSVPESRRIKREGLDQSYVYDLSGLEFSPPFHIPVEKIKEQEVNKVRVTMDVFIPQNLEENKTLMVFSVEGLNVTYHYTAADFSKQNLQNNVWSETEFIFIVPSGLTEGALLKSYIWNLGKSNILIDNFKVEIFQHPN